MGARTKVEAVQINGEVPNFVPMPRSLRLLLLSLLLAAPLTAVHAQEGGVGKDQQEKIQAKKKKEEKKARARKEKDDRKRHLSHQDKATRKRMKKNQRRADKHGSGAHRDPFLQRLFGHKH